MGGVVIVNIKDGDGKTWPRPGDTVKIHYVGTLPAQQNKQFDSSRERGIPFVIVIGKGTVIKGLDEAVRLLSLGQQADVLIPANLAYGDRGWHPIIPPDSTLKFQVEVLEIAPGLPS